MMKKVLTYGTFDTLHYGHIRLLRRARMLGDYLIVGLSTDEFNKGKGKKAHHSWEERKRNLEELRCVDLVIPESTWEQKRHDVLAHSADIFTMGSDWVGHFDDLRDLCQVRYLDRTEGVSSTALRELLRAGVAQHL